MDRAPSLLDQADTDIRKITSSDLANAIEAGWLSALLINDFRICANFPNNRIVIIGQNC
jgi:hypothetical protein